MKIGSPIELTSLKMLLALVSVAVCHNSFQNRRFISYSPSGHVIKTHLPGC